MKRQMFIAAGGKGRRLGSITAETPKSMVRVDGIPIINHIIAAANRAEIDNIVVGLDDGKEYLRAHVEQFSVDIEERCIEPLTMPFFNAVAGRRPDIVIGVNGDTLYHPESVRRVTALLDAHPDAAAAVLLTKVTRPVLTSSWTYWAHRFEGVELVAMDEVPGHHISTEYMMAAFRVSSLETLSEGFVNSFTNPQELPFKSYSAGWDYLTRILLWKQFRIVGMISDDLALNINHPIDLEESKYFHSDPGYFRWRKLTPLGSDEPLLSEQSLVMIKPQAHRCRLMETLESELAISGLSVLEKYQFRFDEGSARAWCVEQLGRPWFDRAVELLCEGTCSIMIVEGRGGFYRALDWKRRMRERFAVDATNNLVHSTFSKWSFETELQREKSILNLA